jgi:peptide/nickel transport system ATP-binding protein
VSIPVLQVSNLVVNFKKGRRVVHAVSGVSFDVLAGETLGIVGESGCGKSTTGRALIQIPPPTSGTVVFDGEELTSLPRTALRKARTGIQMIFQDPISSLNPRRRIKDIVAEPLDIWGTATGEERSAIVRQMLHDVGLDPDITEDRYPRQFSGGQCQRISIARALVMRPKLLICDEMVSSLDVSVQAQILNLLEDLKARYGLTVIFIAHDLAVVKNVSDRVAVMYLGRICEVAASDDLYAEPAHPYTQALLSAALEPDPEHAHQRITLSGEPPSPIDPPSGCRFRTRCPFAQERCAAETPELRELSPGHEVACHFPLVGAPAP